MARYTVQTSVGPKRKTIYGKKREDMAEKLAKALSDRPDGIVVDEDRSRGELDRLSKRTEYRGVAI